MKTNKTKHGILLTTIFSIIAVLYVSPIAIVCMNSFKKKAYISKRTFKLPTDKMYV